MKHRRRHAWHSVSSPNIRGEARQLESRNAEPLTTNPVQGEDSEALLTVVEVARVLRISRNLVYELVRRGDIPSLRLGRVIRVPRRALDAAVLDASVHKRAG